MRLAQGAAENREVLGEDVHQAAIDPAVAGYDPVPGHDLAIEAEIGGAVGDEAVELDEAPLVEEKIEPLAGRELAFLVLLRHPGGSSALLGLGLPMVELIEKLTRVGHGGKT